MGVLLQVHLSQAFLIQMGQTTGRGTPLAAVTLKCRFRLTGERLPLHSGYTCPQGLKGERGHRKTLKNAPSITSANIKHAWREYGHSKHARKAHNAFFLVSVVCTAVLVVLLKCCIPHLCGLFHSFHKKHLSSKFPTKLHSHGKGGGAHSSRSTWYARDKLSLAIFCRFLASTTANMSAPIYLKFTPTQQQTQPNRQRITWM